MIKDVLHLVRNGILIKRNGNGTEALRGCHGSIKFRSVVSDNCDFVVTGYAMTREATGEGPGMLSVISPRPGLPNAVVFLADGASIGTMLRMIDQ